MTKFIMIIWLGVGSGQHAIVTEHSSMEACDRAMEIVTRRLNEASAKTWMHKSIPKSDFSFCVEVPR